VKNLGDRRAQQTLYKFGASSEGGLARIVARWLGKGLKLAAELDADTTAINKLHTHTPFAGRPAADRVSNPALGRVVSREEIRSTLSPKLAEWCKNKESVRPHRVQKIASSLSKSAEFLLCEYGAISSRLNPNG